MLAELVKAGKLPPVEQRVAAGAAGRQAAPRDRQVRRHLAARLHRPRRQVRTATASVGADNAPVLGLHRRRRSSRTSRKAWEVEDGGRTLVAHAAQGA